jgi:hypothetical protein
MKNLTRIGAVLATLFLAALPALASTPTHHVLNWVASVASLGVVFGAVTVQYFWPVTTPNTTPPTGTQAALTMVVVALLNWADADTTALITHDYGLGLSASGQFPTTGQFFPEVIITPVSLSTAPFSSWTTTWTNSVAITMGKGSIVGSGGTVVVYMRRPHTVGQ